MASLALLALALMSGGALASSGASGRSRPGAREAVALINVAGAYTANGTDTCKNQPSGLPIGKPTVLVISKWSSGGAFSGWARPFSDSSLYGGPPRWGGNGQSEISGVWFKWAGARSPISGDEIYDPKIHLDGPIIQRITDPVGTGKPLAGYITGTAGSAATELSLYEQSTPQCEYVKASQFGPVPIKPSISGFAHKADGSPLAGAEVEIKAPRFDKTLTTAGDGSFGPIDVRAGYRYSVTAAFKQNGKKVHLSPSKCLYGRLSNAACESTLHSRDTLDAEFTLPEPSQLDVHVFASNVTGHSGLGIYKHFSATEAESKAFFTLPGSLNCVSGCWDVTVEVTDHRTGRPVQIGRAHV
jgi:hypothetical protein